MQVFAISGKWSLCARKLQRCPCFSAPQPFQHLPHFPHLSFTPPWSGFSSPSPIFPQWSSHQDPLLLDPVPLDLVLSCVGDAEQPSLLRLYFLGSRDSMLCSPCTSCAPHPLLLPPAVLLVPSLPASPTVLRSLRDWSGTTDA